MSGTNMDRLISDLDPKLVDGKFITGVKRNKVGPGQLPHQTFNSLLRSGFNGKAREIPAAVLAEMTEEEIVNLPVTGNGVGKIGVEQIKKAVLDLASS